MGFDVPLWRGIAAFRVASLVHSGALVVRGHGELVRPELAWTVLAAMTLWTGVAIYLYARPGRRTRPLLVTDLAVAVACMAGTVPAAGAGYLTHAPPLTGTWIAGPLLAWAVVGGRRWAVGLSLGYGVADALLRGGVTEETVNGVVLLLLAAYAVGYMARISDDAERRFAQAVELEARTRERERLARSIHDSVLQALAMVRRRGDEIGGDAGELARLAGEQEAKLRALVGMDGPPAASSPQPRHADVVAAARTHASATVTVSAPADAVWLPTGVVDELDAAVGEALSNVERHCPAGTRVWLLVEDTGDTVIVTVRDDGPGCSPERPAEAEAHGHLGIAQSIKGRLADLGGSALITTAPGEGTEVELRLPVAALRDVLSEARR